MKVIPQGSVEVLAQLTSLRCQLISVFCRRRKSSDIKAVKHTDRPQDKPGPKTGPNLVRGRHLQNGQANVSLFRREYYKERSPRRQFAVYPSKLVLLSAFPPVSKGHSGVPPSTRIDPKNRYFTEFLTAPPTDWVVCVSSNSFCHTATNCNDIHSWK